MDPSGHCGVGSGSGDGISEDRHGWLCNLKEKALELSLAVDQGELNDVEALAQFVEYAAPHYKTTTTLSNFGSEAEIVTYDTQGFSEDIGLVLGGTAFPGFYDGYQNLRDAHGGTLGTTAVSGLIGDISMADIGNAFSYQFTSSNDDRSSLSQYYVEYGAFGDSGFLDPFSDDSNQVRHFSGGLAAAGKGYIAERAALGREDPTSADYYLHSKAFELYHSGFGLDKWGDWIRENLAQ